MPTVIENKPRSKLHLFNVLCQGLRKQFDDPTVEVMVAGSPNFIRLRVTEDRSIKYYRITLVEER